MGALSRYYYACDSGKNGYIPYFHPPCQGQSDPCAISDFTGCSAPALYNSNCTHRDGNILYRTQHGFTECPSLYPSYPTWMNPRIRRSVFRRHKTLCSFGTTPPVMNSPPTKICCVNDHTGFSGKHTGIQCDWANKLHNHFNNTYRRVCGLPAPLRTQLLLHKKSS